MNMIRPSNGALRGVPAAASLFPALLLTVLAASGCASTQGLSPRTALLDADGLSAARMLESGAHSEAAFPTAAWWSALGDPQLDALVREALQDSPSLAIADARAHQAQAQAGLADAARRPTLGAAARYTGVQLPATIAPEPLGGELQASTVLMLDFEWSPDLWGGDRARYEAAVGQARAAEVDAQAARLALASNVARTYIGFAQAQDAIAVAEREQARATRLLALSRQRVEAGLDNQLQLRQGEAAVAIARQQAQASAQQADAMRTALAALLGKGPDRGLDIAAPRVLQAPSPTVPAVLPSELLGHRADVVAARWRVEAASRGIDASVARFKPSFDLNAIVGLASGGLSDLFSGDALLGFGGPALSLPIFDGGELRAALANSNAGYDLAVASYNQSLVGALREVADALQAARSLDAQIATVETAVEAATAATRLADTRYRAGLGTQLDVLSAQRPLFQLEQQRSGLRAQRLLATVDLDRALGGGLVLPSPAASPSHTAGTVTP